ncbi:MAG: cupin domain-containing protein [Gammaproteobacteria bacterium]
MTDSNQRLRRIVTGHDADGRAVFQSVDRLETSEIPSGDAAFATIWSSASVPVDLNDETDGASRDVGLTLNGGSVIRVVDMLPGCASPMHRTNSLDYGIVVSGEVELELDDGVLEVCGAGDIIVQRGTIHLWRNASTTQLCRIVFVLTEAIGPYVHDGAPLKELKP